MERVYTKQFVWALLGSCALSYPLFNLLLHQPWNDRRTYPDKTAIVTGGTGNLAAALTFQFAVRKVRVILACRDLDKCKSMRRELVLRTGHKGIVCRHLDLEDVDSISRFVKEVSETEPHIDILVNNAAVKYVKEKELTEYGIEKNYFVNFLAPFLLTFSLYNKLKETAASSRDVRIINIIGRPKKSWKIDLDDINFEKRNYTPKAAYRQSKLALAYFTILLDKFNREQKNLIYTYGTNPGSNMIMSSFDETYEVKTMPRMFISNNPDSMIMNVVRCALEPSLTHETKTGLLYSYLLSPFWGWGVADKRGNEPMYVWNAAKQTLLNLKSVTQKGHTVNPNDKLSADIQQIEDAKDSKNTRDK